jgi:hypothetical protein
METVASARQANPRSAAPNGCKSNASILAAMQFREPNAGIRVYNDGDGDFPAGRIRADHLAAPPRSD